MTLSKLSSPDEKKEASEAVFELLSDLLFDKISFISFPFTRTRQIYVRGTDGLTVSGYTTGNPFFDGGITQITADYINYVEGPVIDTTRYWGVSRIPNTSEGKFLSPGRKSRMRCSFYVENGNQLDGYILSPVVYDSFGQLNFFTSMNIFRAYAGIKFLAGEASVVIKEAGKEEVLVPVDIDISGGGASTTYRLDMVSNGKETTILIDGISLGVFPSDQTTGFETINRTFLPLLSPARSLDGTEVGITIENYQFIQDN